MLNNISFLVLFMLQYSCFAADLIKFHFISTHLVFFLAIFTQCELNLFFFRQNNDYLPAKGKICFFSSKRVNTTGRVLEGC